MKTLNMPEPANRVVAYTLACDCAERVVKQIRNQTTFEEEAFQAAVEAMRGWLKFGARTGLTKAMKSARLGLEAVQEENAKHQGQMFVYLNDAVMAGTWPSRDRNDDAARMLQETIDTLDDGIYYFWRRNPNTAGRPYPGQGIGEDRHPDSAELIEIENNWRRHRLIWLNEMFESHGPQMSKQICKDDVKPPAEAAVHWRPEDEAFREWAIYNTKKRHQLESVSDNGLF